MIRHIPKDIIKNALKKNNLTENEIALYNNLKRQGSREVIKKYFWLNPNNPKELSKIKKHSRIISIFINNDNWWIRSIFRCTNQDILNTPNNEEVKRYRQLIRDPFIVDENKMLFLRRYLNETISNPMTIDPTEVFFNNPKNYEIFKEMVPLYRIRQALDLNLKLKDDNSSYEILKGSEQIPNTVYTHHMIKRFAEYKDGYYLNDFINKNPRGSSYLYRTISLKDRHIVSDTLVKDMLRINSKIIEFVPEDIITKEMAEIAVRKSGSSFLYLPSHLQTDDLLEIAILKSPSILRKLNPDMYKSNILLKAILAGHNITQYIKKKKNKG